MLSQRLSGRLQAASAAAAIAGLAEPLLGGVAHVHAAGSARAAGDARHAEKDDSDFFEDNDGQRPLRRGTWRHPRETPVPTGRQRTLQDWNNLLSTLAKHKKPWLMRDVVEEMSLHGVRPDRQTYLIGLFSAMRGRKIAEAWYYWDEMRRHGHAPDRTAYDAIISACGRSGQLGAALTLKAEMEAAGLAPSPVTYLALLHGLAEEGNVGTARELWAEMEGRGMELGETAHAALINCYRNLPRQAAEAPGVKEELLRLLDQGLAAAAAEAGWAAGGAAGGQGVPAPGLVVYNAALNSLVELGWHDDALAVFARLQAEGLQPSAMSHTNVARSWAQRAVGRHTLPKAQLEKAVERRVAELDLGPYLERAGGGAAEPGASAGGAAEPGAGAGGALDGLDEDGPLTGADADAGAGHEEGEGAEEAGHLFARGSLPAAALDAGGGQQGGAGEGRGSAVRRLALTLAREDVRNELVREHADLNAWYQALHVVQAMLDAGQAPGPNLTAELVGTAMDLHAAGVDPDAITAALALVDKLDESGMFLDVTAGTSLLRLSSRRSLNDLRLAHRVWALLRARGRAPRQLASAAYLQAILERDSDWTERLVEVCEVIISDPDRSDFAMWNKKKARRIRDAALAAAGEQPASEQQQQQQQEQQPAGPEASA